MGTRIGIRIRFMMKTWMEENENVGNDEDEMRIMTSMRMR